MCGSILCQGMVVWQYNVWRYGCVAVYIVEVWVCGSILFGDVGVLYMSWRCECVAVYI